MQLFVDGTHGPVSEVQVIDDNRVKCDARIQDSVLGYAECVLRFRQRHVAGNAERQHFYAGRILFVSVDDLISVMLTIVKEPKIVVPGSCYSEGTEYENHAFFEASSIRKFDGRYYFIYSSEVMHELCYATSDSPEGPYRAGYRFPVPCFLFPENP